VSFHESPQIESLVSNAGFLTYISRPPYNTGVILCEYAYAHKQVHVLMCHVHILAQTSFRVKSDLHHVSDYSDTIHESYYYWLMIMILWNRSYLFRCRTYDVFLEIVRRYRLAERLYSLNKWIYKNSRWFNLCNNFLYTGKESEKRRESDVIELVISYYKITVIIFSNSQDISL